MQQMQWNQKAGLGCCLFCWESFLGWGRFSRRIFLFLSSIAKRSCNLLSIILNYFIYSPWHLAKILTLIHLLVLRLGKDQSSSFFSFPYAIHFVALYFKFSVATSERKMFCMLMNDGKLRHKTAKVLKHLHGDAWCGSDEIGNVKRKKYCSPFQTQLFWVFSEHRLYQKYCSLLSNCTK